MTPRAEENLLLGLVLAVLAGFWAVSLTYDGSTRLGPLVIASVSILVVLVQLAVSNLDLNLRSVSARELFAPRPEELPEAAARKARESRQARPQAASGRRELLGFGLVAGFLAAILVVGLLAAIFCLLAGYLYFAGRSRWYSALGAGAIGAGIVFVAYHALSFGPYPGLLGGLL